MKNNSNCAIYVWNKFRSGEATYMCIRFTKYSKLHRYTRKWWWKYTLGLIGNILQLIIWPLIHIAELLRSGRWYHHTWLTPPIHREFIPLGTKVYRWLPPILFRGIEQDVEITSEENIHL